ncbi:DUF5343 domain-containing protein [Methyloversatilis discipulorum]|uniref:DUF5343 domain-containing protein n=1 Tax=Methyloversatilis discipulorum TaxID=1119528 RepID=UPI0012FC1E8C|nr:DUF5343 domain-containing protein [Methyloversatilis discipulorum]
MASKHPYTSGSAGLNQAVAHLRRTFPAQVTADTLKKLGIAPNNETYVLNTLRFIGVLDAEGKKSAAAASVFNKHDDSEFQVAFSKLVQTAYADLFSLHGDSAWALPTDKLISFFRNTDHTSAIVGQRQATAFQALAVLGGKIDASSRPAASKAKKGDSLAPKAVKSKATSKISAPLATTTPPPANESVSSKSENTSSGMALTVRVEINLPAGGDQVTYDRIFKSIRENLLNGNAV